MPIYEYRCAKCGDFEVLEKIQDVRENTPCIICGQISKKIISKQGIAPFKTYYTDAFKGFDPIRVDSREQERGLCKESGFERVS
jgi:putative FmdB family regulatory protein